jgi:hypothetical protein
VGFTELVDHLGTLVHNTMRMPLSARHCSAIHFKPTRLQGAVFELLDLNPVRVQLRENSHAKSPS